MAGNQLSSLAELAGLPLLMHLNASSNKLADLEDLPELPRLEYLDLSKNKLASQNCLSQLHAYPTLVTLLMAECPFVEELADRFKAEVLLVCGTVVKGLRMIGEEEVTEEDITAANEERAAKEQARREAEEEARRAAEEAAAAAKEGVEAAQ